MEFKAGDEFQVIARVMEVDDSDVPFCLELEGWTSRDIWVTRADIEKMFIHGNPKCKKKFLEGKINTLKEEIKKLEEQIE